MREGGRERKEGVEEEDRELISGMEVFRYWGEDYDTKDEFSSA